ncbi:hypothetical protein AKJ09_08792 [Labilithrix luteola]|uniref:Uncharacterized protein n=1 Tax=Labilithrix luteola TaxID=1391654 RepID=A0A0K1Q8R8_9BACT|nr:hypothetical protein AKJ09_08792 [Labilithrix luteola]
MLAPQWQDVFDGTPELYAVVRPQAIKTDAIYGTFFRSLLRVAQAKTEMTGVTALEALEGCDEIVIGIRRDPAGGGRIMDDAAIVFRGVPASLDPAKMTDGSGAPLFRLVSERAKAPEYERVGTVDGRRGLAGSLFVLPERTWVVALGSARDRAREAFATPFGRPAPKSDPSALATVRLDAGTFVRGQRIEKSPAFGPLTRKLESLSFSLAPGKGGVIATLRYQDEDASAWAEMHAKRLLEELARIEGDSAGGPRRSPQPFALGWLKDAQVGHEGNALKVRLSVPARLLEELPNASPLDLAL